MIDSTVQAAYNLALLMTGTLSSREQERLELFCKSAYAIFINRLRSDLTAADCGNEIINATALLALAALAEAGTLSGVEQFTAGDISLKLENGGEFAAANCLRTQAYLLMGPYLQAPIIFMGV